MSSNDLLWLVGNHSFDYWNIFFIFCYLFCYGDYEMNLKENIQRAKERIQELKKLIEYWEKALKDG